MALGAHASSATGRLRSTPPATNEPDRVIVYLCPRSGGSEFDFKFRPRMAMNAQSAASVSYDYYNPEARVTVAPKRFIVK